MRYYIPVPRQKVGQQDLGSPVIDLSSKIHFFVFGRSPWPFGGDVDVEMLPSRPADLDILLLYPHFECAHAELKPLIRYAHFKTNVCH
jgi:hypothetical protein